MSTTPQMTPGTKIIYTAKTHTVGGREQGVGRSSDGRLDVQLSIPGGPDSHTNPEQLFGVGWSGCFEESMQIAARKMRIHLPEESAVDAEIDLCKAGEKYLLRARLNVSIPGMGRAAAQSIVDAADLICAYSNAIRGNVEVTIKLV